MLAASVCWWGAEPPRHNTCGCQRRGTSSSRKLLHTPKRGARHGALLHLLDQRRLVDLRAAPLVEQDLAPHDDGVDVLRRAGVSEQTIQELDARLPDPIDVRRDAAVFLRYGITLDAMIDRMGGSP